MRPPTALEAYLLARGCPEALRLKCVLWVRTERPRQAYANTRLRLCLPKVTDPQPNVAGSAPPLSTQALCDALEAVQYEGHEQVSE